MQKLISIIENKEQWNELNIYIDLITENRKLNPNIALDGAKSIMETICKTILANKGIAFNPCEKLGKLIKDTYNSLPFMSYINSTDANNARQILSSFETIVKNIGEFRNAHGAIAHGRDIQSTAFDLYLTELVIASSDLVSSFLIMAHSEDLRDRDRVYYEDYPLFNNYLDDTTEDIPESRGLKMQPSRFLFYDETAYKQELMDFINAKDELINLRLPNYLKDNKDDEMLNDLIKFDDYYLNEELIAIFLTCMEINKLENKELLNFLAELRNKNIWSLESTIVEKIDEFLEKYGV